MTLPNYIELPDNRNERIEVLKERLNIEMSLALQPLISDLVNDFFERKEIVRALENSGSPKPSYVRLHAEEEYNDEGMEDRITSFTFYDENGKFIDYDLVKVRKISDRYDSWESTVHDEILDNLIWNKLDEYASELAKYSNDFKFDVRE